MEFRTVEIICIYKIVTENGNLYVQTVPKYDRNYEMIDKSPYLGICYRKYLLRENHELLLQH